MERKAKIKSNIIRGALIVIGSLLIADTVFVLSRSNWNLGVVMPLILGAPLLLAGLFLNSIKKLCAKSKAARIITLIVSAGYALFILLFSVTSILILTNSAPPEEKADVLIVLGCGIRGDRPTLTMKYRLDKAIEYLDENPDTVVVVSGGQSFDEKCSEASVMKNYLISRGVAEVRILSEDASQSTEENFVFSKELIESELGPGKTIAFVTTRFHVYRSELVAKKQGIEAQGIPAKGVWYITFNDYLRECAALTMYFICGRI